jgi:hypothetical protein
MLQRRQRSQSRLSALIQVATISVESVKSSPGSLVVHRNARRVNASEPRRASGYTGQPNLIAGNLRRSCARVDYCCYLYGLLIECRVSGCLIGTAYGSN